MAPAPSLMDNQAFLAELDGLEGAIRGFVARTPKADEWNPIVKPPAPIPDRPWRVDEEEPPEEETVRAGRVQRLPALVFVLLMCIGASGAAAVFHARVAQIVEQWHVAP
jgi:hypothetical protein